MMGVRILKRNDRGFHAYGKRQECTRNTAIDVYESSAADGPHLWLSLHEDAHVFTRPEPGQASAHLSRPQAERLIARLQTWVDEIPGRWNAR